MSTLIGRNLGPYQIIEQIGRGGMSTVFKAYHAATDRHIAIKVLPESFAKDPHYLARFEREAKLVASLQHIHILPVFDYGQQEDITYLVMPYVSTGPLRHRMEEEHLDLEKVSQIFRQIADALDYAHETGVLHRDIKPDNVLLDDRDNVLLSDFGIARLRESSSNLTGETILGTPDYMSPEQAQGKVIDSRSDIYSLGVMLYELVVGDLPYHADTPVGVIMKHITEPPPDAHAVNADISEGIKRVILKAMAKDPDDRFQLAGEMSKALTGAMSMDGEMASRTSFQRTAIYGTKHKTTTKHHAFISYSRTDVDVMHSVRKALIDAGVSVWTDEGINPGTSSWKQAIQDAIKSSDCVICILSPDAVDSRWVREELDFADIHEKSIFLVHARGEEREVALFGFATSQRVDVRDEATYDSSINLLIDTIRKRIGLDETPLPTPAAIVRQHNRGQLFYPNQFARATIDAMEEIMGRAELDELLKLADLAHLIDNPPPNNMKKEFDFADNTALNAVLDESYGFSGGEALKRSVGRASFASALKNFGAMVGVSDLALKAMPLKAKLKIGIPAMARVFSRLSDQVSKVHDVDDHYIYTIERCPMCWGYQSNRAVCHLGQGLLQEGLIWVSGGRKFNVVINTCISKGDDIGHYLIYKEPIG